MKFSIVIPTYNLGNYLPMQVKSILKQEFRDFEIVIVDDGSTDNTEEVVNSFNDRRIRYFYENNSGVSAARNKGLSESKGQYIIFVDADDTCDRKMLSCINKQLDLANKTDILLWGYTKIFNKNIKISQSCKKDYSGNLTLKKIYELEKEDMISVVYNKAIRSDIARKVKFKNTKLGEDYLYNLMIFEHVRNIKIVSKELYYYNTMRENSAYKTYSKDRIKNFENQMDVLCKVLENYDDEFLKGKIIDLKKMQSLGGSITNLFNYNNPNLHMENINELQIIKDKFKVKFISIVTEKGISKKVKIKLLISKLPTKLAFYCLKKLFSIKNNMIRNA